MSHLYATMCSVPPSATPRCATHDWVRSRTCVALLLLTAVLALPQAGQASAESTRDTSSRVTASSRTPTTYLPVLSDANKDACLDVVFIGARGSGEPYELKKTRGLGKTVYPAFSTYAGKMTGYRVGSYAVPYPAHSIDLLLKEPKFPTFFRGLEQGRQAMWDFLRERAGACPEERYVLAGYSQGAMVTHRVMWLLDEKRNRHIADRVDGFLLVADGDRISREGGEHYGSSDNTKLRDVGMTFSYRAIDAPISKVGAHNKKVPRQFATGAGTRYGHARWHSVCKDKDLVCDFPGYAGNLLKWDASIHGTYAKYSKMHTAAKQVAKASRLVKPKPAFGLASTTADTATAGKPYAWTMTPIGSKPPYTISAAPGFPPSLTINALTNTMHGVPTQPGTFSVPVTVTDAVNRSVAVTITLVVNPAQTVLTPTPTTPGPTTTTPDTTPTTTPTVAPPPATVTLPVAAYHDDYRVALSLFYPVEGTWMVTEGELPPGLTLHADGTLAGVPAQALEPTSYTVMVEHRTAAGSVTTMEVTVPHHGWDLMWGCAQMAGNEPGQPPWVGATGQLFALFHAPAGPSWPPTVDRIGVVRLNGVDHPLQAGPGVTANRVVLPLAYGEVYDLKVFVGGKLFVHDEDIRTGMDSQCSIVTSFPFPD